MGDREEKSELQANSTLLGEGIKKRTTRVDDAKL
jgi:hypothetical protein